MKQWRKSILKVFVGFMFFSILIFTCHQIHAQGWSDIRIRTLPDSSFALVEYDKYGSKVRHFPYRDANGKIDVDQVIYCLGTFADETWVEPEHKKEAQKQLKEHYQRFKQKLLKEGINEPVDINKASLKDLVRLTNIGPVTAVKIYLYREAKGLFQTIEDIKKVEGIGPAVFAGIRHYIKVY